jgi:hypothetical protein
MLRVLLRQGPNGRSQRAAGRSVESATANMKIDLDIVCFSHLRAGLHDLGFSETEHADHAENLISPERLLIQMIDAEKQAKEDRNSDYPPHCHFRTAS